MFLQFYGLNEQPFGVTPDPRFLYMGRAQQEAFASLVYGIETGRGFMALIASPGLGKTTILLRLMERLRESARTAFLFQTHTSSEEFLRSLLADLDIEPAGRDLGDLQRQLGDVLIREAPSGKRFVVAIDEAQNLDDQVLEMVRMLSNFETPHAKLLQIVLVGQPQLARKLASPHLEQLRQRVSIITHFPPLDGSDVPKYIDHRLRIAGYRGGELFTPAALRLIVTHSKGIPRNINNLCFQGLSLGFAKNARKIDDAIIQEVIADLSLESFRPSPPVVAEKPVANTRKGAGGSRKRSSLDLESPMRPVAVGSPSITPHHSSPLDAVNLSSGPAFEDMNSDFGTGRTAGGRFAVSRRGKNTARPWLLAGLAALLMLWWAGPQLRPHLDILEGGGGGGTNPKTGAVATPHLPIEDETNSPGAKTDSAEDQSSSSNEDLRQGSASENPVPEESEADSTAPRGANHVAPAINVNSSRPPERHSANYHEVNYPPTALPEGRGRLIVESSESGARITINGESNPLWVTPRIFHLASGTYVVSVSRGSYTTWTSRVHVEEGRERLVMAKLENQEGGYFTVDTNPPGMQVFIDGRPFGPSRVETVLQAGWHICEVIPGPGLHPLVRTFHLGPGEAITRRIRMSSPEASLGNNTLHPGSDGQGLKTGSQGGTP